MAKEQEEAEQDVGWFAKKNHCPREQEATKGGSCAACKCTDREKKERKKKKNRKWAAQVYYVKKSERTRTTAKFLFLIHIKSVERWYQVPSTKCTKCKTCR